MKRFCKTCSVEVGKGKSYCGRECRPGSYYQKAKVNPLERKCKVCDILVGKGKSYCKPCFDERKLKLRRIRERSGRYKESVERFRKNNPHYSRDYYRKHNILPQRYCKTCSVEVGKGKHFCDDCLKVNKRKTNRIYARKYRSNLKNRLTSDVRTRVWQTLKDGKKHKSTFDALGYTPKQLMEHLEKYMEDGMNWDNYTKHGWHIDHTKPVAAFDFSSTEDEGFKECWSLDNLRPMWAKDNWKKNRFYAK